MTASHHRTETHRESRPRAALFVSGKDLEREHAQSAQERRREPESLPAGRYTTARAKCASGLYMSAPGVYGSTPPGETARDRQRNGERTPPPPPSAEMPGDRERVATGAPAARTPPEISARIAGDGDGQRRAPRTETPPERTGRAQSAQSAAPVICATMHAGSLSAPPVSAPGISAERAAREAHRVTAARQHHRQHTASRSASGSLLHPRRRPRTRYRRRSR